MRIWNYQKLPKVGNGIIDISQISDGDTIYTKHNNDDETHWILFNRTINAYGYDMVIVNKWLREHNISMDINEWTSEQRVLFELRWG